MIPGNRTRAAGALIVAGVMAGAAFVGATIAQEAPAYALIAGGGFGDGGLATAANLHAASDIVFDGAGNAYISQSNANRIRKVSAAGVIATLAGGTVGFSGDFGLASAAAIDRPGALARDNAGNLYFADTGNHRVRRIAPNGLITTVAGNGSLVHGGDGGLAVNAGIANPSGLAVDGNGNLYIADSGSHRIRKVTVDGMISTVAGTGAPGNSGNFGPATSAMLNTPVGLALDAAGNLYFSDLGNRAVRKVAANGIISAVLINLHALDIAVDATGALHAGDLQTCSLRKLVGSAMVIVAGVDRACADGAPGGTAATTAIGAPDGIAFDTAGNVVFVDSDFARVRKVTTSTGGLSTFGGVGGQVTNGTSAVGAPLSVGAALAVEADGDVILSDSLMHRRLRRITPAGAIYTLAGNGLFFDTGQCATSLPCPASQLSLEQAFGVAHLPDGTVLVGDRGRGRIVAIAANGTASRFAGLPGGTNTGDGGPATSAKLDPYGIARDNAGNTYVADYRNHRIRRIDNGGTITTWAGNGNGGFSGDNGPATSAQINLPMAVATDAQGNVYFSDGGNRRVRKVTVAGLITTIAGNGLDGVTGDGGPATHAAVGSVRGIAVDATGVVYIASEGRLRRILVNGVIESLPGWTNNAMALATRNGQLYIGTREGLVYRLPIANARRVPNDYDGDGKSDLPWHHAQTGANIVWKAANSANTLDVMDVSNPAWQIVGQGDFDGDGKSDLAWRNSQTGANTIWRAGDHATQIAVTGVNNLAWKIVGVGDFNGDGKSDLLWRNHQNGQNVVWHSGNAATQTMLSTVPAMEWKVVGVGDFDGDGKSDLLWRNTANGTNSLWRSGNSTTQLPITGVNNLAWKIQGVGDFDGDGRSDVFWRNVQNGTNVIWRSANSAQQVAMVGVTSQLWQVVAVGDYDGDGKSDLAWRNSGYGTNTVWRSGNAGTQLAVTGVSNPAWSIVPYEHQP